MLAFSLRPRLLENPTATPNPLRNKGSPLQEFGHGNTLRPARHTRLEYPPKPLLQTNSVTVVLNFSEPFPERTPPIGTSHRRPLTKGPAKPPRDTPRHRTFGQT